MATGWHPLLATAEPEAAKLLRKAITVEPRLTRVGVGVLNERYKTQSQIEREVEEEQEALRASLAAIAACADWLQLQRWLNTFTLQTSYRRKYDVEIWFQIR